MPPGANGLPDPAAVEEFSTQVGGIVDLEIGPDGDLYYLDILAGAVHHISYDGTGNQPPVAMRARRPRRGCGAAHRRVQRVDTSTDPEHGVLTYAWDLDGDGAFDDSTAANPSHTYTSAGVVNVASAGPRPAGADERREPHGQRRRHGLTRTDDRRTHREHDVADRPDDQLPGHGHRRRRRRRCRERRSSGTSSCSTARTASRATSTPSGLENVASGGLHRARPRVPRVHRDHPHRDRQHRHVGVGDAATCDRRRAR